MGGKCTPVDTGKMTRSKLYCISPKVQGNKKETFLLVEVGEGLLISTRSRKGQFGRGWGVGFRAAILKP